MNNITAFLNSWKRCVFILAVCILGTSSPLISQVTDTVRKDSLTVKSQKTHSPKKAALLSTILPGAGQVYNKKYWKMPLIYGGVAALVYSLNVNQSRYVRYRDAYKYRVDNDANTVDDYVGLYRDSDLFTLQKTYNRYRDLSVMGLGLLYILNIVDASVDAHLFSFDVSDNLSLSIHPTLINTAYYYHTGISINIKL